MQNKLQELTDKLYKEGLSKGQKEAEDLKVKAKNEYNSIIAKAKKEAEGIINKALKEAEDLKSKAADDVKMASHNSYTALKQKIEGLITTKVIDKPVAQALDDSEFLKQLIIKLATAFNAESTDPVDMNIIFPEAKKKEMNEFITKNIIKELGSEPVISFSRDIKHGFKIGPKDGGYLISFSDEVLSQLFSEYLRPDTKKLLFD
ncbi:MAG: hypothetical protein WCS34_01235 [Bacteroidales bacterium]